MHTAWLFYSNDLRYYLGMLMGPKKNTKIVCLAWTVVVWAIAVILWGAWVRISGSGAGCGEHWPLCQGAIVPSDASKATWVEYTHRASTGIFGVLVIALVFAVFKSFARKSVERKLVVAVAVFTLLEALIGAKLVLLSLVGTNESIWRAVVMAAHLLNTLLLLGSAALIARALTLQPSNLYFPRNFLYGCAAFGLLASSGSIAALSNTLYPSTSISEGIARDLAADGSLIFQLRILHPVSALLLALVLWLVVARVHKNPRIFRTALTLAVCFGAATLVMLAPVWMKLTHLLFTDSLWVTFVALSARQIFAGKSTRLG